MELGVFSFNTESAIPAYELAVAAEQRGFESVWLPEHTHIPVFPIEEYPGYPGGKLPEAYAHMSDPLVGLAAAAAVTSTIKLGTGILLVNQHDPIVLAKQVATLDRLSGGRVIFGVGAGWNRLEMQSHGIVPAERWTQMTERIQALKAMWTEEEASFSGQHVKFDPIWSYPKPVTRPHPPILLGSMNSPTGRKLVAEHCDGWIPVGTMLADLGAAIAEVRDHARQIGRDPETIPISMFCVDQPDVDRLQQYQDLGVVRTVVGIGERAGEKALAVLDRYAELIPKLR